MSEDAGRPAKRRPAAEALHPRRVVEGAARAAEKGYPEPEGDGLGSVGGPTITSLLDQAKRAQSDNLLPYLFPLYARNFFDTMHAERYDILGEIIDEKQQSKALWRLWRRVMIAAVPVGISAFTYASGILDKWLPVLKRLLDLWKGMPS